MQPSPLSISQLCQLLPMAILYDKSVMKFFEGQKRNYNIVCTILFHTIQIVARYIKV